MIKLMAKVRDRILVVENDPVLADLIARQALGAAGYQTAVAVDAGSAIAKAIQWAPDLIVTDMNLPGLSGKDLMVALTSQKINTPVILIAARGQESDLIQTFRLGAADYLIVPVREAEVVTAVERVLQQVHERHERERLAQQLQQANQELQTRVRELTAITAVGKAVTSITDSGILMEKILEGAVRVTQADLGWFLLRDEGSKNFHLAASSNLPLSLGVSQGQTWDDGISSLVAISGEPLAIHGEALKRFKISILGQAALITPIRAQKQVVGLLVVMRKAEKGFGDSEQHLLDTLADYAAISLMNAHLFRAAENRARSLQVLADNAELGEQINNELLRVVRKELTTPVEAALGALTRLGKDPTARWRSDQRQWLSAIQDALDALHGMVGVINPLQMPQSGRPAFYADICEVARAALRTAQPFAQAGGITFAIGFPKEALFVNLDDALMALVVTGLVSNAIKFSTQGGQVAVRIEKVSPGQAHLSISNNGMGVDPKETERIFEKDYQPDPRAAQRFGGIGVRLSLIQDIVKRQGGKIWLESRDGKGATFHIQIPVAR
jgi:signal transduction histidine kinase/FixJ family two-component response regulator